MYNFRFTLKNDKAMELFYEHVITECRKYFGVQNKNVTFRVNYNEKEDFLIIAVFCDEVKDCAIIESNFEGQQSFLRRQSCFATYRGIGSCGFCKIHTQI